MSTPLVSIVVPIYGVESYLRQCIDSILAQTLREIEVILVDDGSPDTCPAIVDEYAARDPRIVAVHQPNGGYGKAVNHGISLARAPYIGIIESDDWIEPGMYEKLYQRARETGAELVKSMFWEYNSQEVPKKQNILWRYPVADLMTAPEGTFTALEWERIFMHAPSLWSCLYKAELIRKVPVIETAGAAYQDAPFVIEITALAKSISIVKEPFVHYRREPDQGSSSTGGSNRSLRVLDMSETVQDIMARYRLFEQCKEACYYHIFSSNMWGMSITGEKWQEEYYQRFRPILLRLAQDDSFTWKYLDAEEKEQAEAILQSESHAAFKAAMQQHFLRKKEDAKKQYPALLRKYRWLQFLYFFSLGKRRKQLKERKSQLKQELRTCRGIFRRAQ